MIRLACAILLVGCVATTTQNTPQSGPPGSQQASVEGDVVCRAETPTGSLISREVCHRKDSLEEQLDRDTIVRALQTPRPNPCGGAGCPMHP